MATRRILIAAGGTGGHFYPGLAVLEAMNAVSSVEPMFVGTPRGIEARVVPTLGHRLTLLDISPLNGVRGMNLIRALAKLPRAAMACRAVLKSFAPHLVLSVGGYAAGPIAAMSLASRIPTAVIEPNAIPGLTHRLIGRFVDRAFVTHPNAASYFASDFVRAFGSPVRRSFLASARTASEIHSEIPHVLVLGGSQGARAVNRVLPGAAKRSRELGAKFTITHQTGVNDRESVASEYAARGLDAEVVPFIDDVAQAMARADLLVCRSGASTVAEVCVMGRAALYIPLPTAADDHQRKNAESVSDRGAAQWIDQRTLTEDSLGHKIFDLLSDREQLQVMSSRARLLGAPDSADRIAADLLSIMPT